MAVTLPLLFLFPGHHSHLIPLTLLTPLPAAPLQEGTGLSRASTKYSTSS